MRYDTIELELREEGLAMGMSLTAALFRLGPYWKVNAVGRLQKADGEVEFIDFGTFHKFMSHSVELLEGYDRRNAEEHLNQCREELRREGWQEIARGQRWYSLRFQRPHVDQ